MHVCVAQCGNLTNFPPRNFFENFPWNQSIKWLYFKTHFRNSWKTLFRGAMRYFALIGIIIHTYFTTKNYISHSGSLWFTQDTGPQKWPNLTLDSGPKRPDLRSLKVKNQNLGPNYHFLWSKHYHKSILYLKNSLTEYFMIWGKIDEIATQWRVNFRNFQTMNVQFHNFPSNLFYHASFVDITCKSAKKRLELEIGQFASEYI